MGRRFAALFAGSALLAIAGCGAPGPGPNAAATSVQAPSDVPLATAPGLGQEASAVAANQVEVQFSLGSARLSSSSTPQLDTAARLFRDVRPVAMFVAGYSDASGDEYANLLLSARRAQTVKLALAARGIPADRLLLRAYGTSEPLRTNGSLSPGNRRVVISWRVL